MDTTNLDESPSPVPKQQGSNKRTLINQSGQARPPQPSLESNPNPPQPSLEPQRSDGNRDNSVPNQNNNPNLINQNIIEDIWMILYLFIIILMQFWRSSSHS